MAIQVLDLNHVSLHVADLELSRKFYREIIGLEEIPRPDFDFPGIWFKLGSTQELHLIGNRYQEVNSQSRGTHFAVRVKNLDDALAHLSNTDARFMPIKTRSDGTRQLFVVDPDGHYLELCEEN
jgi:catechol 2,3-dioxygenase-like lactoylglutathione lyase family enzyme